MNEVYVHALKLLQRRDYTIAELRSRLVAKFGAAPEDVIQQLIQKNFLNDRRFAENYVAKRKDRGEMTLRNEMTARGIAADMVNEVLEEAEWPSLREAMAAKMKIWQLSGPLQSHDAARLFRALLRLGYDEDAIREEIERLK
jgi:SOS response regulatory protein OraA/RecX